MMNKTEYATLDAFFEHNDLPGAEAFLAGILEEAAAKKDLPAMLPAINELGGIFRVTGRLAEAGKLYLAGLDLVSELGLQNTAAHGTTLLNYAGVLAELKQYQNALARYRETEAIYDALGIKDAYQRAALSNNISHMLSKLGRAEDAIKYAQESLDIIRTLPDAETEKATSHATLGARQLEAGMLAEALGNLLESQRIFAGMPGHPHPHLAGTLNSLGELYTMQGKQDQAKSAYLKALDVLAETQGKHQAYRQIEGNLKSLEHKDETVKSARKTGMDLARGFYLDYGQRMIREEFPHIEKYMAVGLVGEGSECFGFDDAHSESHDFGPGFCIWLPEQVYRQHGQQLQKAYDRLQGMLPCGRTETREGKGRVGVHSIPAFFKHYIGVGGVPASNTDWLLAPETSYATISNGEVFVDHHGEFSRIRQGILDFYPTDVLLKKVAARFAVMSQTGQYNYQRCVARGDFRAACLTCGEFVKGASSFAFLIHRQYMPFYKWTFRAMETIPGAEGIRLCLEALMKLPDTREHAAEKTAWMEKVCRLALDAAAGEGWVQSDEPFLNSHCRDLMLRIKDPAIQRLPVMYDAR